MAGPGHRNLNLAEVPHRLAEHIRELLRSIGGESIAPFLADWPSEWRERPAAACALPVLSWLEEFSSDMRAVGRPVIAELCRVSPALAWRQTYTAGEIGEEFLRNYGWTEILGTVGPLASERLACGFLLLGPDTRYPPHRHAAQEIYIPLSGAARWLQGDAPWRRRQPGTVIQHASEEPHAMQTDEQPLLALYLWRGDTTPSRLC